MWETEIEETIRHAQKANIVVAQLTEQLDLYKFDNCDERILVALPLLKSSIDVAAAAIKLLTLNPVEYGGAAEAMFRLQLERYMRAVFFGSPALTDNDEVRAFREDDKMPVRPKPRPGKTGRAISFDTLTTSVGEEIAKQTGKEAEALASGLANAIIFEKEGLHGAVHGGRFVIRRYSSDGGVLAHNPWALAQGYHIKCVMLIALLALVQAAHLHGLRKGSNVFLVTREFEELLRQSLPEMPNPLTPSFASWAVNYVPSESVERHSDDVCTCRN